MAFKTIALVPCYNVEKFCRQVIEEIIFLVDCCILIDDGSTDKTAEILREIKASRSGKVILSTFAQNQGKGVALLEGMRLALEQGFQTLITIDSDGQHLPSDMGRLIALSKEGVDLVIGSRNFDVMPLRSKVGNVVISFFLSLRIHNAPRETQSGYRAMSRRLVEEIVRRVRARRYEMELECILVAFYKGYSVRECPIHTIYIDKNRSSHFSVFRDTIRVLLALFKHWKKESL